MVYAEVVNQLPQLVWTCTPEGECDFLNDRWAQFTGIPPAQQLGQRWLDQFHPEDRAGFTDRWRLAVARGTEFGAMVRMRRYDGVYHWFDARANPLRDEAGRISKWYGSNTDVQLTQDLHERIARQAVLLDLSLDPFLARSLDGTIEYWNKGCEHCYGFDASEAIGRISHELLQTRMPDGERWFVDALLQVGTWTGDLNHTTRQGETLTVLSRMQVVDYQGRKLVLESNRDITQRKQAEAALRLWAETFERAEFALAITDAKTNTFQAVNATYARERGYTPTELLGASVFSVYPPDRSVETEKFVVNLDEHGHGTFESEHLTKDGRRFPVWLDITTLKDRTGQAQSRIACTFDITKQKAAETARELALHEAERLARVRSEFIANMSHEIRTPLNAILGFAQVGYRDSTDTVLQNSFAHILTSGRHLLGVIDDILDFSKIEAGKLAVEQQRFALNDVLDNAVALVAAQAYAKGLDFQVQESADLPEFVLGDRLRLGQVLGNLLANAVKFTASGQVTLTIAETSAGFIFTVQDTGIGMSSEVMSRLFQAFSQADGSTTRRFGGTGLGLMISQRLVDLMGGTVAVSSAVGAGSTFEVCVPLAAAGRTPRDELSGRIVLAGMPTPEAERLARWLTQRGLTVETLAPEQACAVAADLWVLDSRFSSEPLLCAAINAALERKQNLAFVRTPGSDWPDHDRYRERVQLLERPLRGSHIIRALSALPDASLPVPGRGRLTGLRLLAIDDEEVNRTVLAELLRAEGARLVIAASGQSALQHLIAEGPQCFDLVLMDVQMPEMDGYATTRRIHALAPSLAVIGLTAHALPEERHRCLNAGMLAHLTKPVDLDALVAAIRHYSVESRQPAERPPAPVAPALADGSAAQASENTAPINWLALEARFAGRPGFVHKLCRILLSRHALTGNRLRAAALRDDYQELTSLAHSLNGVSANLHATAVQALAVKLETAAHAPESGGKGLAEDLARALEALLAAATVYLQQPVACSDNHIPEA